FHFNQGMKKSGQNNKHDALRSFQKAIELEGNNLAYLSQYAYLLAEVGRGAEAEHILINEFIQHRYDAEFYFILSQLYIKIGRASCRESVTMPCAKRTVERTQK